MHKQTHAEYLLKKPGIRTRMHQAPVFKSCKPNNEKAKQNVLYRGAILWNGLLRVGLPEAEAENAKVFIRNISELMSNV